MDLIGRLRAARGTGEDATQAEALNTAAGIPPQSLMDTIRMLVPEGGRVGTNVIHYSLGSGAGLGAGGPNGIRGNVGRGCLHVFLCSDLCACLSNMPQVTTCLEICQMC